MDYIELKNKKEVARVLAGYSSYTRALYKGIYFDRAWYNIETIKAGIEAINLRLEHESINNGGIENEKIKNK